MQPPKISEGRVVSARYQLQRLLGKGGMGEVWQARDTHTGDLVAIKIVCFNRGRLDATEARFKREAELAARLTGPSFVDVFGYGTEGDEAFLVMELLVGETLEERLQRVGSLELVPALSLIEAIGAALDIAHAQRIVHRDLKPGNVFFCEPRQNESGVSFIHGGATIKLFDFGVAKDGADEARLTKPDMLLGSAHYMAPEQIRAVSEVDARADVWSLAVILFRVLTGALPFRGDGLEALVGIIKDRPLRPSELRPSLPAALDPFFQRALEKSPELRFQSVAALVQAFAAIVAAPALSENEPPSTVRAPRVAKTAPEPASSRPTLVDLVLPTVPAQAPAKVFSWSTCALTAFVVASVGIGSAVLYLLH